MESKGGDNRSAVIAALTQVAETMALRDVLLPALHATGRQDLPTDSVQLREFVLGPLSEWAARSIGPEYAAQVLDQLMPVIAPCEEDTDDAPRLGSDARPRRRSVFRRERETSSAAAWPRRNHATTEQDPGEQDLGEYPGGHGPGEYPGGHGPGEYPGAQDPGEYPGEHGPGEYPGGHGPGEYLGAQDLGEYEPQPPPQPPSQPTDDLGAIGLGAVAMLLVTENPRLRDDLGGRLRRFGALVSTTVSLRDAKKMVDGGGVNALVVDHAIVDPAGSWHQTALLQAAKLQNVSTISLLEAGDTRRFGTSHRVTLPESYPDTDFEMVFDRLARALRS